MQDIKDFIYFFSIKDNISLTHREIKKITYKATFDKISKYIDYINKIMRKLINNASKQIRLLFERYL